MSYEDNTKKLKRALDTKALTTNPATVKQLLKGIKLQAEKKD